MAETLDGVVAIFGIRFLSQRFSNVEGMEEAPRLYRVLHVEAELGGPKNRASQKRSLDSVRSSAQLRTHRSG